MRTYKISINGYGSEVTIGSVNEDIKKILNNPDKELVEAVDEDVKKLTTTVETQPENHSRHTKTSNSLFLYKINE